MGWFSPLEIATLKCFFCAEILVDCIFEAPMPSHAPASPDTAVSFKAGDRAVVLSTATGGINAGVPIGWIAEGVESREAGEFVGARLLADGRRIDFQITEPRREAKRPRTHRFRPSA